ncbi:hypothetical protein EUTSA_v100130051mg, partial [Eutrema salsugineum]
RGSQCNINKLSGMGYDFRQYIGVYV